MFKAVIDFLSPKEEKSKGRDEAPEDRLISSQGADSPVATQSVTSAVDNNGSTAPSVPSTPTGKTARQRAATTLTSGTTPGRYPLRSTGCESHESPSSVDTAISTRSAQKSQRAPQTKLMAAPKSEGKRLSSTAATKVEEKPRRGGRRRSSRVAETEEDQNSTVAEETQSVDEDDRLTVASSNGYNSDVPEEAAVTVSTLPPVAEEAEEGDEADQDDKSTVDSVVAPEEIAEINVEDEAEMITQPLEAGDLLPIQEEVMNVPENAVDVEKGREDVMELQEAEDATNEVQSESANDSEASSDENHSNSERDGQDGTEEEGELDSEDEEEDEGDYSTIDEDEDAEDDSDEEEDDEEQGTSDSEDEEAAEPVPATFTFAAAFRGAYNPVPAPKTMEVVDLASSSSEESADEEEKKVEAKPVRNSMPTFSFPAYKPNAAPAVKPMSVPQFSFPGVASTNAAPEEVPKAKIATTPAPVTFSFPSSSSAAPKFVVPAFPTPVPVPVPVPQSAPVAPVVTSSAHQPAPPAAPATPEFSKVLEGVPTPIKTAIDAFNKVGSKFILATAAKYQNAKDTESLTLSEQEYDVLKGLLDQVKPKSLTVAVSTSSEIDEQAEKKKKVEVLTVDVTTAAASSKHHEKSDQLEEQHGENSKKIKFDSAATVIRSRLSLDGIGPTSPMDDNFTTVANKFGHVGTPFNRRASTSSIPNSHNRMLTRQPTPFHKGLPDDEEGSDYKKKRSFFDYADNDDLDQGDDYDNEFSAKKRLSVSFDNVKTVIATPASALGSASKRSSTGGLDRFSANRLPFVPQFKGTSVQFSTFTAPAVNPSKSSEISNLSYIERRKLNRSSIGSSNVVAKQILEALSTIPTPAAEKPVATQNQVKPLRTVPSTTAEAVTKREINEQPVVESKFEFTAPKSGEPAKASSQAPSFTFGTTPAPTDAIKKFTVPEFNFKLPVNAPPVATAPVATPAVAPLQIKSTTAPTSTASSGTITLTKSVAPVSADNEFVFEEPLVVSGVDDSITKTIDSSICYVFSAPNQQKVSAATSTTSSSTVVKNPETKKDHVSAETPSVNIWAKNANSDTKKCSVCMVQNKKDATKCVSCESPFDSKPTSSSAVPSSSSTSSSSVAVPSIWTKAADGVKCTVCLVMNKKGATKCASCESPIGGGSDSGSAGKTSQPVEPAPSKFVFGAPTSSAPASSSVASSGPFTFGGPPTTTTTSSSAPATTSGFVFGATPSTSSAPTSASAPVSSGFTFGAPHATDKSAAEKLTKDTEEAKPSGFQFAFPTKSSGAESTDKPTVVPASSNGFTFGASTTSSSTSLPAASTTGPFTFGATKTSTDSAVTKSDTASKPVVPPLSFPAAPAPTSSVPAIEFGAKRNTDDGEDEGRRNKRRADTGDNESSSSAKPSISFNFSSTSSSTPAAPATSSLSFPSAPSGFSFGTSSSTATTAAPAPAPTVASIPAFTFGAADKKEEKKDAPIAFTATTTAPTTTTTASTLSFGSSTPTFTFGASASKETKSAVAVPAPAPAPAAASTFLFGGNADAAKPAAPAFSFNTTSTTPAPAPVAGLFGSSSASSASTTDSVKPLFGGATKTEAPVVNPFSSSAAPSAAPVPSFSFGGSSASVASSSSAPLFGSSTAEPVKKESTPVIAFGGTSGASTTTAAPGAIPGIFGSSTSSVSTNPFSSSTTSSAPAASAAPLFGPTAGLFGASAPTSNAGPFSASTSAHASGSINGSGFATSTPSGPGNPFSAPSISNPFNGAGNTGFGPSSTAPSPAPGGGFSGFGPSAPSPALAFSSGAPAFPPATVPFVGGAGVFGGPFSAPQANPFPNPSGGSEPSFSVGTVQSDGRRKVKVRRPGQG